MRTLFRLVVILLFAMFSKQTLAQYEKKITLQGSLGYVSPLNPSWFQNYYSNGTSSNLGIQFNFNRKFSLALLANSTVFLGQDDLYKEVDLEIETNSKYFELGIGVAPKYIFVALGRFSPFVLGGISANYLKIEYFNEERKWDGEEWDIDTDLDNEQTIAFGFNVGAGLDYRISDNFSLFTTAGIKTVWSPDSDFPDVLNALYVQLGININLIKSKTL